MKVEVSVANSHIGIQESSIWTLVEFVVFDFHSALLSSLNHKKTIAPFEVGVNKKD